MIFNNSRGKSGHQGASQKKMAVITRLRGASNDQWLRRVGSSSVPVTSRADPLNLAAANDHGTPELDGFRCGDGAAVCARSDQGSGTDWNGRPTTSTLVLGHLSSFRTCSITSPTAPTCSSVLADTASRSARRSRRRADRNLDGHELSRKGPCSVESSGWPVYDRGLRSEKRRIPFLRDPK